MNIKTTYKEAIENYPEAVGEIVAKLRNGTSKEKNAKPEDLEWSYSYGIALKSYSFAEMLQRRPEPVKKQQTPEGIVDDTKFSVALHAKKKKWWASASITGVPDVVRQRHIELETKNQENEKKEQERLSKLTPQEQDAEVEELLRQLRGPGFAEFRISPR